MQPSATPLCNPDLHSLIKAIECGSASRRGIKVWPRNMQSAYIVVELGCRLLHIGNGMRWLIRQAPRTIFRSKAFQERHHIVWKATHGERGAW